MDKCKKGTCALHVIMQRQTRDRFVGLCKMQGRTVRQVLDEILVRWTAEQTGTSK